MTAILTTVLSPRAAVTVQLANRTVMKAGLGTVVSYYRINTDGKVYGPNGIIDTWLLGGGAASSYEVKATLVSGSLASGTTGAWLPCSSVQTWAVSNSASNNSILTAVISVQLRAVADPNTILASATVTIEAESDNNN